jgi:hypothetical protein
VAKRNFAKRHNHGQDENSGTQHGASMVPDAASSRDPSAAGDGKPNASRKQSKKRINETVKDEDRGLSESTVGRKCARVQESIRQDNQVSHMIHPVAPPSPGTSNEVESAQAPRAPDSTLRISSDSSDIDNLSNQGGKQDTEKQKSSKGKVHTDVEDRRARWAELLEKRPRAMDSDRMSAWLMEVFRVSDFQKPLKEPGVSGDQIEGKLPDDDSNGGQMG